MTFLQQLVKWVWGVGMVVLALATVRGSWSQFHAQSHAQASSAASHVVVLALAWAFWSLGGLIWLQKFKKGQMAKN
jgi:hypothetical protein